MQGWMTGAPIVAIWSAAMPRVRSGAGRVRRGLRHFSTFEKALVANSAIIVLDTIAGWWITQHNPETYHYLIDTLFIALATLVALAVNFAFLWAAFAPLHSVLATIRAVEHGDLTARAIAHESDTDVVALARAFNDMLDHLLRLRDETATRVLHAQEAERRRLALELHDQTGQTLTALALHAQAIAQRLAMEEGPVAGWARLQTERLGALAQEALVEVQSVSRQLRPAILDDLGLVAALRWLAEDAGKRLGCQICVQVCGWLAEEVSRLPDELETALFRIAQESVTNAIRHGKASYIRIRLRAAAAHINLTIADNGCGFDSNASHASLDQAHLAGLGIDGMRERARLLGGTLRLWSRKGKGCVARAAVPLPSGDMLVVASTTENAAQVGGDAGGQPEWHSS
jgi:two-component system sensor histidine kinase UhpB